MSSLEKPHKIGVLIATYHKHDGILNRVVHAVKDYPKVVAYDGNKIYFHAPWPLALQPKTWGWQTGERKNILAGARKLFEMGCDPVFKICGDSLIEKPGGIKGLPEIMGNHAFLCHPWGTEKDCIGTMFFLAKIKPLLDVAEYLDDEANLNEALKELGKDHGQIEWMYGWAAKKLGYTWLTKSMEWWKETIGFKDLRPR